jgi:hypothetical protein
MAKKMSYVDAGGTDYPESYWIVDNIKLRYWERIAHIVFIGFNTQADREAGYSSIGKIEYHVYDSEYDDYFSQPNSDIRTQAYQYALDNDVFFNTAIDVPGE